MPTLAQQDSLVVRYDTAPLEVKKISDADLSSYRENPDFNYEVQEKKASWLSELWQWLLNQIRQVFEWIYGVDAAVGPMAFFLKLLPYLLLFFLIFLLIRFFLNANIRAMRTAEKNRNIVGLSEEEHIIKNENIDDLIKQALEDHNYRLAVRYSYLLILKLLSEKEIIAWELQKTNSDYLNEIQRPELKIPFGNITRLYDYIWYGDFAIDETKYQKAAYAFNSLKNKLKKNA
tara:strand:- start:2195 stop:2890 length:696 start_codon:yes stop_codon:yes gene_type:complete